MQLADLAAASRAVAAASGRLDKIAQLGSFLARVPPDELAIVVPMLTGSLRQGSVGIGWSMLAAASSAPPSEASTLELAQVDAAFARLAAVSGAGAAGARAAALGDLFRRATSDEQAFLRRLLSGDLRQGALEGVVLEAVARAAGIPAARVRRAVMLAGGLAPVARVAIAAGDAALSRFMLQPFQPVQPMLADSAADVSQALATLDGPALLEYKLDGARIQAHKDGDDVRVYSRTLRDVTAAVPEVVDAVRAVAAREIILDGEAITLRADGWPHPFQTTMRRFGRKMNAEPLRAELPITPFFFDVLFVDGAPLVDEPLWRRAEVLAERLPPGSLVPRLVAANAADADAFVARALAAGHEGVMAKRLDGSYAAGRRGSAWFKIKRVHTLDLVVLAAEWGSGRRKGTLSNLHLGARDARRGTFVMLGKTFKGLTDEMLAWQTDALLALETGRDANVVFVRPALVVEIAFNDIQESPQYQGGLALRFARVKAYRPDKSATDADTFETVQRLHRTRVIG
jgi:DNA ligase-1